MNLFDDCRAFIEWTPVRRWVQAKTLKGDTKPLDLPCTLPYFLFIAG
jgi:hypothetical protein